MSFYKKFPPGKFQQGATGTKIFQAEVLQELTTNKKTYNLREKSPVERNHLLGIWVDAPVAAPQKADESNTIVNRNAFDATYLTLKVDSEDHYERIPLRHIEKCNDQGRPYYVDLGSRVNLSESKIECFNSAAIGSDEVVGLRFDYVKPV